MFALNSKALSLLVGIIAVLPLSQGQAGDFAWEVEPNDGFPTVEFSGDNSGGEVVFQYGYQGTLSDDKFLKYELLQYDCLATKDDALSIVDLDETVPNLVNFGVDVNTGIISDSVHYENINTTFAEISFCSRVDYMYTDLTGVDSSVNFHETKVKITVDRTANFSISAIDVIRVNATEQNTNAELDYPVVAYYCDEFGNIASPQPFAQGSAMQVCVKVDDSIVTEAVYVQDILSFTVSQPLGPAAPSVAILNSLTDALTAKACGLFSDIGLCNVKTQLQSKFFTETEPNNLRVDGTALLAFGSPSAPTRMLRAKISGMMKPNGNIGSRSLQDVPEGEFLTAVPSGEFLTSLPQSPFDLEVTLEQLVEAQTESIESLNQMVLVMVVLLVLFLTCGSCAFYYFAFGAGARRQNEQKSTVGASQTGAGAPSMRGPPGSGYPMNGPPGAGPSMRGPPGPPMRGPPNSGPRGPPMRGPPNGGQQLGGPSGPPMGGSPDFHLSMRGPAGPPMRGPDGRPMREHPEDFYRNSRGPYEESRRSPDPRMSIPSHGFSAGSMHPPRPTSDGSRPRFVDGYDRSYSPRDKPLPLRNESDRTLGSRGQRTMIERQESVQKIEDASWGSVDASKLRSDDSSNSTASLSASRRSGASSDAVAMAREMMNNTKFLEDAVKMAEEMLKNQNSRSTLITYEDESSLDDSLGRPEKRYDLRNSSRVHFKGVDAS